MFRMPRKQLEQKKEEPKKRVLASRAMKLTSEGGTMVRKDKSPDKPAKKAIKKSAASEKPAGSDGLGLFDSKADSLAKHTEDSSGEFLTTNQGVRVNDNQNSLKAGDRGPTLLEDFILREKITHFDHERIPERVVHARGSGAHGVFRVYEPM